MPSKKLKSAGVSTAKFDRCVEHVKGQKGVKSAFGICEASFQKSLGLRPKRLTGRARKKRIG